MENITVETINKNKYKKEEVQNMDGFMKFKKALQKHFDEMQKEATHLFEVNVDKDELLEIAKEIDETLEKGGICIIGGKNQIDQCDLDEVISL